MSKFAIAVVIVLGAFASGVVAQSKPVLDQSNVVFDSSINDNDPAYAWQQSITPSVTGRLTRIDLFVDASQTASGATQLTLSPGSPWQTAGPAWRQLVTLDSGWNSIHITRANFSVSAGQPFTVGLHCPNATYCGAPFVGFSYNDAYTGGALFLNGQEQIGDDLMFQIRVQPR